MIRTDAITFVLDARSRRGRLARVGTQIYDGGVVEYRPPEEVFAPESIASFEGVPLRVGHEPGPVVGFVRRPRRDGSHIVADLEITDGRTEAMVDLGRLTELSAGYACELDPTPGIAPDGTRFHAIQRKIRADHLALLPPGHARCGSSCSIHRADALQPPPERKPAPVSCNCSATARVDALAARRDAFRASAPHRAHMSDNQVDVHLELQDRMARQEAAATAPSRADAAVSRYDELVSRVDAAAAAAGVSGAEVRRLLATTNPTDQDIANAVFTAAMARKAGAL